MAKLTADEVKKLAKLSRLRLATDEINQFSSELSEILDYVRILEAADISGLEPTYQITGLKNVMRPDKLKPYQAKPAELLKNAPAVEKGQFKVKRVL